MDALPADVCTSDNVRGIHCSRKYAMSDVSCMRQCVHVPAGANHLLLFFDLEMSLLPKDVANDRRALPATQRMDKALRMRCGNSDPARSTCDTPHGHIHSNAPNPAPTCRWQQLLLAPHHNGGCTMTSRDQDSLTILSSHCFPKRSLLPSAPSCSFSITY